MRVPIKCFVECLCVNYLSHLSQNYDAMPYGLKRSDLRAIAQSKVDDANILLQGGRSSNAYYLAGYAVEIGLKACIAAQVSAETIPDKAFLKGVMNHQFSALVGLAGLAGPLKEQQDRDAEFGANWGIVNEWSPDCRYETRDQMSAQVMIDAVLNPGSGVLQWIKAHW
jgi:hypothetical protein